MSERIELRRKSFTAASFTPPAPVWSSDATSATPDSSFGSQPTGVLPQAPDISPSPQQQLKPQAQETPDLTEPEQRFLPGHDFSKISIFPPQIQQSTSQGDEPPRIEATVEPVVQRKLSTPNQSAQPTYRPLPGHNFSRIPITPQSKLTVSQPDDPYEQEADRMAEQVMRMPAPAAEQDEQHQSKHSGFTLNPIATAIMAEVRRKQEFDEAEQLRIINSPLPVPLQRQVEEPELEATDELTQPQNNLPLLKEEEEEIYTKPDLQCQATDTPIGDQDLGSRLQQSKGSGSPLADEVRAFMEPRFGADFGQVRVHTDGEAVHLNRELSAQAGCVAKTC